MTDRVRVMVRVRKWVRARVGVGVRCAMVAIDIAVSSAMMRCNTSSSAMSIR